MNLQLFLNLFLFVFLFTDIYLSHFLIYTGNWWVYRLIGNWSSDSTANNYCHPTLYFYSFWLITGGYIFIGFCCTIFLVGVLCVVCCSTEK